MSFGCQNLLESLGNRFHEFMRPTESSVELKNALHDAACISDLNASYRHQYQSLYSGFLAWFIAIGDTFSHGSKFIHEVSQSIFAGNFSTVRTMFTDYNPELANSLKYTIAMPTLIFLSIFSPHAIYSRLNYLEENEIAENHSSGIENLGSSLNSSTPTSPPIEESVNPIEELATDGEDSFIPSAAQLLTKVLAVQKFDQELIEEISASLQSSENAIKTKSEQIKESTEKLKGRLQNLQQEISQKTQSTSFEDLQLEFLAFEYIELCNGTQLKTPSIDEIPEAIQALKQQIDQQIELVSETIRANTETEQLPQGRNKLFQDNFSGYKALLENSLKASERVLILEDKKTHRTFINETEFNNLRNRWQRTQYLISAEKREALQDVSENSDDQINRVNQTLNASWDKFRRLETEVDQLSNNFPKLQQSSVDALFTANLNVQEECDSFCVQFDQYHNALAGYIDENTADVQTLSAKILLFSEFQSIYKILFSTGEYLKAQIDRSIQMKQNCEMKLSESAGIFQEFFAEKNIQDLTEEIQKKEQMATDLEKELEFSLTPEELELWKLRLEAEKSFSDGDFKILKNRFPVPDCLARFVEKREESQLQNS